MMINHILASRRFLWSCVTAGVALRLAFIVLIPFEQIYDNGLYFDFARAIASGQGFVLNGRPTAFWSGGYPVTLGALFAVTGPSLFAARVLNLAAAALSIILVHGITTKLTGDAVVGGLAATLMAVFPSLVAASSVTMTEQIYLATMLGGMLLFVAYRDWVSAVIAGFLFGYSTFLRSQSAVLPACIFGALLIVGAYRGRLRRELLRFVVVGLLAIATIVPWMLRNERAVGAFVLSTNGGVLFAMGHNPQADGGYMHPRDFADSLDLPEVAKYYDTMAEVVRERTLRDEAIKWAASHPSNVLALWPRKLWITFRSGLGVVNWIGDGINAKNVRARSGFGVFRIVAQVFYMLLWGITLAWLTRGIARFRWNNTPRLDPVTALTLALFGHTAIMTVAFIGNARYAVTMYPFLCMASAAMIRLRVPSTESQPGSENH